MARPAAGPFLAALVAVTVLVGLVGFGVVLRPATERAGVAAPSASTPSLPVASRSPAATTSPDASLGPSPSRVPPTPATVDGIVVLRGGSSGWSLLAERLGWACFQRSAPAATPNEGGLVDKMAITRHVRSGWLDLPDAGRVWLGDDMMAAAKAFGARVFAVGTGGDRWILTGTAPKQLAAELRSDTSPAGRTFWSLGGGFVATACPSSSARP